MARAAPSVIVLGIGGPERGEKGSVASGYIHSTGASEKLRVECSLANSS